MRVKFECYYCGKKLNHKSIFIRKATDSNGTIHPFMCAKCFRDCYKNDYRKPTADFWEMQKLKEFQTKALIEINKHVFPDNFDNKVWVDRVLNDLPFEDD